MKINERILKYLSGNISEKEKQEFETELKNSNYLRTELLRYENLLKEFKTSFDDQENFYFNNLLPKVRESLKRKTKRDLIPKLAISGTLIILLLLIFEPFDRKGEINLDNIIMETDEALQYEILNSVSEDGVVSTSENLNLFSAESILSELTSELELDQSEVEGDFIQTSDIMNNITAMEADQIYQELITKKIVSGD